MDAYLEFSTKYAGKTGIYTDDLEYYVAFDKSTLKVLAIFNVADSYTVEMSEPMSIDEYNAQTCHKIFGGTLQKRLTLQ